MPPSTGKGEPEPQKEELFLGINDSLLGKRKRVDLVWSSLLVLFKDPSTQRE